MRKFSFAPLNKLKTLNLLILAEVELGGDQVILNHYLGGLSVS